MAVAVFLDTMIYLHYRPVDQIDWRALLGEVDLALVLPRVTAQELDEHKNTHPQRGIRERARRVLTDLDTWSAAGEVKPGMSLEFRYAFPKIDLPQLGLRNDWNDDILLGAVLEYQADTEHRVVLFSDDTSLRMTAQQVGIDVRSLDDKLRLPIERDPIEIERDKLRREVEKLTRALPRLSLQFASDGSNQDPPDRVAIALRPGPREAEQDFTVAVDRERQRLLALLGPTKGVSEKAPSVSDSVAYWAFAQQLSGGISEDERARYLRDLESYLAKYQSFLEEDAEFEREAVRRALLSFEIVNTGTAPAEDVDIQLHFPDGFHLLKPDEVPVKSAAPDPPEAPRSLLDMAVGAMNVSLAPRLYMPGYSNLLKNVGSNVSDPKITRTNSYDVHFHVRRVKHGYKQRLGDLVLEFEDLRSARPFHIDYWLRPANLPEAVPGRLHVVVQAR